MLFKNCSSIKLIEFDIHSELSIIENYAFHNFTSLKQNIDFIESEFNWTIGI